MKGGGYGASAKKKDLRGSRMSSHPAEVNSFQ